MNANIAVNPQAVTELVALGGLLRSAATRMENEHKLIMEPLGQLPGNHSIHVVAPALVALGQLLDETREVAEKASMRLAAIAREVPGELLVEPACLLQRMIGAIADGYQWGSVVCQSCLNVIRADESAEVNAAN